MFDTFFSRFMIETSGTPPRTPNGASSCPMVGGATKSPLAVQVDLVAWSPSRSPLIHSLARVKSLLWTDEIYRGDQLHDSWSREDTAEQQRLGGALGSRGSRRTVGTPVSFRIRMLWEPCSETGRSHVQLDLHSCWLLLLSQMEIREGSW